MPFDSMKRPTVETTIAIARNPMSPFGLVVELKDDLDKTFCAAYHVEYSPNDGVVEIWRRDRSPLTLEEKRFVDEFIARHKAESLK